MFTKILIANRGEIAVRVMRTCRELGITAVAVYSEADRDALHVRLADEAHYIGPSPAAESYLSIDNLVRAALISGAQAVHPGYGFLAENPGFADACLQAGLQFIGPGPDAIRRLGNKVLAKQLAEAVNVPVIPGYYLGDEAGEDGDATLRQAGSLGYPLMIKAAAGGGGRGMRLVQQESGLMEALAASRREVRAAFGDDTLFLERYVERARHVEIQVIGDSTGQVIYLGERECSLQRRNQKVMEEAPAPGVDAGLRRRMGEAAVALARAGGYTNAGTVEFLLDEDGNFYFLEMNTRLQVEHPVTEMVTGLDLVRLQLLVADGQPLPIAQDDVTLRGHAVEARLYAEDPAQGYLPQTGSLIRFGPPAAPGVRNDVGVYEGAQVSPYYDPMLAKLIVYGQDRDAAVDRLRLALNDYVVMGVKTNLDLLKAIAQDDRFRAGHTTTQFIAENLEPGLAATPEIPADAVMAAVACQLEMQGILDRESAILSSATLSEGGYDPWRGGGRWRLGKWGIEFSYQSQGQTFQATATRRAGTGLWEISTGDESFLVEINRARDGKIAIRQGDTSDKVSDGGGAGSEGSITTIVSDGGGVGSEGSITDYAEARSHEGVIHLFWKSRDYLLEERRARAAGSQGYGDSQEAAQGSGTITAPIPGKVVEVRVRRGDRVSAHQTLVVLEAMKMEHLVAAPYGAVVGRIHPRLGDEVARGAPLIELEAP